MIYEGRISEGGEGEGGGGYIPPSPQPLPHSVINIQQNITVWAFLSTDNP